VDEMKSKCTFIGEISNTHMHTHTRHIIYISHVHIWCLFGSLLTIFSEKELFTGCIKHESTITCHVVNACQFHTLPSKINIPTANDTLLLKHAYGYHMHNLLSLFKFLLNSDDWCFTFVHMVG